jgi:hypothetical protein
LYQKGATTEKSASGHPTPTGHSTASKLVTAEKINTTLAGAITNAEATQEYTAKSVEREPSKWIVHCHYEGCLPAYYVKLRPLLVVCAIHFLPI